MRRLAPVGVALVAAACRPAPGRTPTPARLADVNPSWHAEGHEPAYLQSQVEVRVLSLSGNPAPRFPKERMAAKENGRVVLQFVVDTLGQAEAGTDVLLEATDTAFARAVLDVLPLMRFYPAKRGGRTVRQLVVQPFTFCATSGCDVPGPQPSAAPDSGASPPSVAGEVETSARSLRGNPQPRYPRSLRTSGIIGRVVVRFVVDSTGRADMATFQVIESPHDALTRAVRDNLPKMRFEPARIGTKPVRQLVVMPFTLFPQD